MKESEFKNSAPTLLSLKNRKPGFVVPSNYFDAVDDSIEIAILQSNFDNGTSFSIPKTYFENIEDNVIHKISKENNTLPTDYFDTIENQVFEKLANGTKVIALNQRRNKLYGSIAIAASLALLFTLQIFTSTTNLDITSLSSAEIENWISDGEMDLNTYEVATLYDDFDSDNYDIYNSYDEDDILNYLEDVNLESLILTD